MCVNYSLFSISGAAQQWTNIIFASVVDNLQFSLILMQLPPPPAIIRPNARQSTDITVVQSSTVLYIYIYIYPLYQSHSETPPSAPTFLKVTPSDYNSVELSQYIATWDIGGKSLVNVC